MTGARLDSKVMVVKSAKLPTKPKAPSFRAFSRFEAEAEELREYFSALQRDRFAAQCSRASGDVEDEADWLSTLVGKVAAGFERFDRSDHYEQDEHGASWLTHSHISKRLALVLASFPAGSPGSAESYLGMMTEHVSAIDGLNGIALESACRAIVEEEKFCPATAEVIKAVTKAIAQWDERKQAVELVERARQALLVQLHRLEAEERKRKHDDEIRVATIAVKNAIERTQRLAKEIEAAKANLAGLVELHAAAEKTESELNRKLRALFKVEEAATNGSAADGGNDG